MSKVNPAPGIDVGPTAINIDFGGNMAADRVHHDASRNTRDLTQSDVEPTEAFAELFALVDQLLLGPPYT